jgi:hypothetical protein
MTAGQMPAGRKARSNLTVAEAEAVLEEWFGSPVVLTSSGRGAINLALSAFDLNRYRHQVALPRMISGCVLDAVIRHAFPVDAAGTGETNLTLSYHQYGYPQVTMPAGRVIEDICHSFFAGVNTGCRSWAGQMAVFSLTKFFTTSSMAGGVVVHDHAEAAELRRRRDSFPWRSAQEEEDESDVHCSRETASGAALSRLYLSRLTNPRISDRELGGLPKSTAEIAHHGERRREIIDMFCGAVGECSFPAGWREMMREKLPYFFPLCVGERRMFESRQRLREAGIETDIYSIDVARNMRAPRFERMLLVPCHDIIPSAALSDIEAVLRWAGSGSAMSRAG